MRFELKYKILLHKRYFDTGFSILHYFRYILFAWLIKDFVDGLSTRAFIIAGGWAITCYIFGYLWFKYNWIRAEAEVGNRFNLLNQKLRKHLDKSKV